MKKKQHFAQKLLKSYSKVAEKLLWKAKVAGGCQNSKKLLQSPKVAKKLPSTIGTGLSLARQNIPRHQCQKHRWNRWDLNPGPSDREASALITLSSMHPYTSWFLFSNFRQHQAEHISFSYKTINYLNHLKLLKFWLVDQRHKFWTFMCTLSQ